MPKLKLLIKSKPETLSYEWKLMNGDAELKRGEMSNIYGVLLSVKESMKTLGIKMEKWK